MVRRLALTVASLTLVGLLGLLLVTPVASQPPACQPVDQSTEEILPGVVLAWDSSFLCVDVPDQGDYTVTVTVANSAGSAEAVVVESLALIHATPRPHGQAPAATAQASGLPAALDPGASASVAVAGQYELATTDEGKKANLHLKVSGRGAASGQPFSLGLNVHLRGPGAVEDGGMEAAFEEGGAGLTTCEETAAP